MAEKKRAATPNRKPKKVATPIPAARRRFTENSAVPISLEKRAVVEQPVETAKGKAKAKAKKTLEDPAPEPPKAETEKQKVCRLWFEQLNKRGLREVRKEFFSKVKTFQPDLPTEACKEEDNRLKNRYDDVFLIDKTRVKVKINPDKDDYIHASFVEVSPDLVYICAQGPLSNTVQNFWLMCFQEEVKVILQLCQNIEDGNEKCSDYLPTSTDWTEFGAIKVKISKEGTAVQGIKKVLKTIVTCQFDDKEATITHLLYSGWPDHAAPESVPVCREVRSLVNSLSKKKPIVLHCSAGIGRTGTFVAVEMVCHKLLTEQKSDFDMVELMRELRSKRRHAIQNDTQYSFIFRCVVEILIAEQLLTNSSDVVKFNQEYEKMVVRKKDRKRAAPSKSNKQKRSTEQQGETD